MAKGKRAAEDVGVLEEEPISQQPDPPESDEFADYEDSEPEPEPGLELTLARATLVGDIRDAILQEIKHGCRGKAWSDLHEIEQIEINDRVSRRAREITEQVLHILLAETRRTVSMTLKTTTISREALRLAGIVPNTPENVDLLGQATGGLCLLLISPMLELDGERAPPEVDADQGDIPV